MWCWVAAVRGRNGGLFKFDRSALSSWVAEEGDMTEEDEDDQDGICFASLESWFENKETVLN